MRLIYITQTCPPEPGATKRPLQQAKVLSRLGHKILLITAFPNYPQGHIYSGYRGRLWMHEYEDGVQILRVRSFTTPNYGTVRRLFGYLSFSLAAMLATLCIRHPDAVIASVPAPFTEFGAWIAARLRRSTFIIELRDLLPDNLQYTGINQRSLGYRLLDFYYSWIYRRTDIFALAYEWMADKLKQRGVCSNFLLNLSHGMDFSEINHNARDSVRSCLGLEKRFVITYAGSFSPYYKVISFLDGAKLLSQKLPSAVILLIGTGSSYQTVKQAVEQRALDNVILIGGVPPKEVYGYLQASDAFLHPQYLPEILNGTKIIEYLAAGKPILNICHNTSYKGQAEHYGIGCSIDVDDAESLAESIYYYAQNPKIINQIKDTSRSLAKSMFNRNTIVTQFAKELEQAINQIPR